ncbi:hypothetical protein [Oceanobacillus kimchii]|uniref:hypothetical protein n=1 Tax=Oceanobacillus kimchii TaxID=746691 RepID=UPI000345CFD0|nr:hypothetical protein [Oceanobacillus kimchii]
MILLPPIKRMKVKKPKDGLVYCLEDMNRVYSESIIEEVTQLHDMGYCIEDIAGLFDRDEDEIFIGLYDQARKGNLKRPIFIQPRENI